MRRIGKIARTNGILIAALLIVPVWLVLGDRASAQAEASASDSTKSQPLPVLAVSVIKPNTLNDGRWKLAPTGEGWSGMGISVKQMVMEAYGIHEDYRISGCPKWTESMKYDFVAKVDDEDVSTLSHLTYDQRRVMLQRLLSDRFGLAVHFETKESPVYMLVVAKGGSKLHMTNPAPDGSGRGREMTFVKKGDPHLVVVGATTAFLANHLSVILGRTVVDKTGLVGRFDFELDWTPDSDETAPDQSTSGSGSIFTALQEQLGLKMKSEKGQVPILAIDRVSKPSPN